MGIILNGMASSLSRLKSDRKVLEKSAVKLLLGLAQSDREWECTRYAVFKVSGISPTEARRRYAFENIEAWASAVDKAIQEAQSIKEAVDELAKIQEKAVLATLGIELANE